MHLTLWHPNVAPAIVKCIGFMIAPQKQRGTAATIDNAQRPLVGESLPKADGYKQPNGHHLRTFFTSLFVFCP
jgi:hypothetical protein